MFFGNRRAFLVRRIRQGKTPSPHKVPSLKVIPSYELPTSDTNYSSTRLHDSPCRIERPTSRRYKIPYTSLRDWQHSYIKPEKPKTPKS